MRNAYRRVRTMIVRACTHRGVIEVFDRHWAAASDEELLRACRHGDTEQFALLWDRHRKAGIVAARSLAPGLDPDDLVSSAYLKIFELVKDGRGPQGAFRPYLYQVIKTIAADRLRSPESATADLDEVPDLHEAGPWEDNAFDLNAVAAAFATLAPRWQAALWYTEVEQMPPREAAKLLGISANSTSALAARAREALKSAWVEAHVSRELAEAECQQTLERLQRYQRGKLTAGASREVAAHLDVCDDCAKAAAEFSTLNQQLGLTLGVAVLGTAGAAALLGELGLPSGVSTSADSTSASASTASAGSAAGAGLGATVAIVSGVTAAAIALIGGAALVISNIILPTSSSQTPDPHQTEQVQGADSVDRPETKRPQSDDEPPVEAEESDVVSETWSTGLVVETPAPREPAPKPPAVDPPIVDPPLEDPSLDLGFVCFASGTGYTGTANTYGVIRARVTPVGGSPVEVMQPQFDPSHIGEPGNLFDSNGTFTDLYGNTFDFGFFSGTDPAPSLFWTAPALSPLDQWSTELTGADFTESRVEFRLVVPDGRYSPWALIKDHGDSLITC